MQWLVHGLIPEGQTVLLLGSPHSGKSWILEQLAVCLSCESPLFGEDGFVTKQSSVILIDEDTPGDVLKSRLIRLCAALKKNPSQIAMSVKSMTGFHLESPAHIENLLSQISFLPKPVVVAIDSLHTVTKSWNENRTSDAQKITAVWNRIRLTGATLVIAHHASLKMEDYHDSFDFTGRGMGNTQLVAGSDGVIGCWAIPPEGSTQFLVRTKPRRTQLLVTKPFTVFLKEGVDWAALSILEEASKLPSENARRVFPLFKGENLKLTVQEVMEIIQKDLSETDVRETLHELEQNGCLVRGQEGKAHRYRYSLPPQLQQNNQLSVLNTYQEVLLGV